jgi:hypothetical protein
MNLDVKLKAFFTSALDRVSGQLHELASLSWEKLASIH